MRGFHASLYTEQRDEMGWGVAESKAMGPTWPARLPSDCFLEVLRLRCSPSPNALCTGRGREVDAELSDLERFRGGYAMTEAESRRNQQKKEQDARLFLLTQKTVY